MPQRNGQNPIRRVNIFDQSVTKYTGTPAGSGKNAPAAGICPSCKAEVPSKPGFRFSALTCPKCGASMGKK
jgi:predicted amidophosphoribosyltransferase